MSSLQLFHPVVQRWFQSVFAAPTRAQELGWPLIEAGSHTLVLAPTGSGKTLAAFLSAINHVMFAPPPQSAERCRVLYISPLRALAVDVEKNLRSPIAGISDIAGSQDAIVIPTVAIRSGDTPSTERAKFSRNPADILITTPESLYLLLTSNARETLRSIRWVIVDEIHAMVASKRGAHLALSLERLESITRQPLQRIGLSATQRPPEEAARFLGGGILTQHGWQARPVSIVNAGISRALDVRVSAPSEEMSPAARTAGEGSGLSSSKESTRRSIWPSLHSQIVQLIRSHRSTLIFVNNRRLAERVAAALNELAREQLVGAHHGSVAREQRLQMEDDFKNEKLPCIVATSSLELGIDMGAIDLVIQIESPPGVAAALQRIGRSGHQLDKPSKGIFFPKYRGDLLACAALTKQMLDGAVEELRYLRNPLDVLAQQIVAMVSMDTWTIADLERTVRQAAPYSDLSRALLENVLDMLSGRYPSHEFSDLRPRIVWDRKSATLQSREGAKRIAIANAGTIPDRGLYHVFLAGADPGKGRVGELDEEMVFETRAGETFLLGATTWRVQEITHDRVIVSPAPAEPGKMPFWRGEAAGRSLEFGRAIGGLVRKLNQLSSVEAQELLIQQHRLDTDAAANLLAYLAEQQQKTGELPDDKTIVVERYQDDLGDWRVCVLSTFGAKVHAPWTHAIEAAVRKNMDLQVETLWSDDGMVIRFPGTEEPPSMEAILLDPENVEQLVVRHLGASALFASRFREAAARALLLPRRYPGQRSPLWQQRKRAYDLLQVTAKYPDFPILLETYREVLRDDFDMPGLIQILRDIRSRRVRVIAVDTNSPSPFASSLLFNYVGNFIYEGDAPLAERRAQALSVDQAQLRQLLGESELRELLDPEIIENLELRLQQLDPSHRVRQKDGVHDLLLRLGDLSRAEILGRCSPATNIVDAWMAELSEERRIIPIRIAGEERWIAVEDAGRYRSALGIILPADLPAPFLEPVSDPLGGLVARYARTHGPFPTEQISARFGIPETVAASALTRLEAAGRVVQGQFRRGKAGWEWCDADVLRSIRQKSLFKLRQEVEPVEPAVYGRFLLEWHQIASGRKGPAALLEMIEQLQGYPLPASVLETQILPARLNPYDSRDLDTLLASGVLFWMGVQAQGQTDGRIRFYLTQQAPSLLGQFQPRSTSDEIQDRILNYLESAGASFFPQIVAATQVKFKQDAINALWDLVWAGEVTNDTLMPLRARLQSRQKRRRNRSGASAVPQDVAGRWSLVRSLVGKESTAAERLSATAGQLLSRWGIVTRETVSSEKVPGGFSSLYPVYKLMEESGRIRRGYFIAGRGAAQFADAGALERLRSLRDVGNEAVVVLLAATDPANPYGAPLPWPQRQDSFVAARIAGAQVVLVNGELAAFWSRAEHLLLTFFSQNHPDLETVQNSVASALAGLVESGRRRAVFLKQIDGRPPAESHLAASLIRQGFVPYSSGWQKRGAGIKTTRH